MTTLLIIGILIGLILINCPVFIALGVSGLVGIYLTGGMSSITALPMVMYSQVDSFILIAIPLFIFMGEVLANSGVGRDLFDCLSKWLSRLPGGLAIASVFACALFGAACGVSVAGVGAIGPLAVPEMLKKKYNQGLAAGSLAAAGALATLIPPSIVMVVYGSLAHTSVAKLFIGGLVPGIVLMLMMGLYIAVAVKIKPELAPLSDEIVTWGERFRSTKKLTSIALLGTLIMVSLYSGAATPTEVAAMGSVGAMLISRFIYKSLDAAVLKQVIFRTTRATVAIMVIVASSQCLGTYLNLAKIPEQVAGFALGTNLSPVMVVIVFMLVLLVLGMFVDGISMIVITTPIMLPAILSMGFDPLWYGIILALNIELAVISPPVGLNLYMMKSVVPGLHLDKIITGALPFLAVEFACLLLFIFVPELALWLPRLMG